MDERGLIMQFNHTEPLPGSAYDTWREAGRAWARNTNATSPGARLIAVNALVSGMEGNMRETAKRAFTEGAK